MYLRVALLAALAACACPAQDALSPAQRQANIDSFEQVWRTVRDRHWDPKPGGLDWQAVHDELRPKIEKAATMADARGVISSMLERLKQSHFGLVPGEVYQDLESEGARDGGPGIDVRVVESHAIVTSVDAGSPAEARGVKPGWEILSVDGKDVAPSLRRIQDAFRDSTLLDLRLSRSVLGQLSGAAGKPVKVGFLDAADRAVTLDLDRANPRGTPAKLGNMPPMYFWAESRKAAPGIGYVRFNLFFEPDTLSGVLQKAVNGCPDCAGFIIDLRGNPGGIGGLAMGAAGWFLNKPGQQLGTMYMRTGNLKFVVFPRPNAYQGPLAILVDGCSASTAEIFAGGLKDLGRARIFGTRTAGAALPSMFDILPNGDAFQYAIANYISEGGRPLEGIGVTPDEEAGPARRPLLEGKDPALDAAIRWIEKNRK